MSEHVLKPSGDAGPGKTEGREGEPLINSAEPGKRDFDSDALTTAQRGEPAEIGREKGESSVHAGESGPRSDAHQTALDGGNGTTVEADPPVQDDGLPQKKPDAALENRVDQADWQPSPESKDKVPAEWGEAAENKKAVGVRWTDPSDVGNGVRIDKGDPESKWPSQRVDHVIVRSGGKVLGRDGMPIEGSIKQDAENAHIPQSDWQNWQEWNKK